MTKLSSAAPATANSLPLLVSPACACGMFGHSVQFYDRDEFMIDAVGKFLQQAFEKESNAVVIATGDHLVDLARHLKSAGVELDDLVASGRFVTRDAAETLRSLMVDDALDAEAFSREVGSLVAKLTLGGRPLCIFGEMVALLWADGKTEAAIQLEEMWNALSRRHVFSLFCAYPMKSFATDSASRSFQRVCQAHSRVLPTEEFIASGLSNDDRLRTIAFLQQKAAALEAEVAQRKRVEATLRRREAELTALVETASLGIHWVDAKGTILWANQAEFGLLGYTASEYIGRNIAEFHADQEIINDILGSLSRGENVRNRESRLRCKDGTLKIVLIDSSILMEGDRFVHSQCFTRDITEQRRGEEASLHLAAIVAGSDDAILSKSLEGVITSWNYGAENIFGYTPAEIIGRHITVLVPADRLDEENDILARLRRGERVDHYETKRRCKDGTLLDVSLTISPVMDGSGRIVGASKIARDITDKKRAEVALETARDQLARMNEELERRVEERTASLREAIAQLEEFSYTVSHDLRAPLRGMQVYSQALLEDHAASLDAEAQHCLGRIAENASRLDKMVMDVLTFSRVSRTDLRMETVQLDKLVRDIIQQYPAMLPPRAVIEVTKLHDVQGHEPSLTQVVSNLLANAVKFVAPGITPLIRVWTERTASGVSLFVRDNGIGIKPEQQSRLFKMFERVHPGLPYEGTGVGLAIVRKAALRMGGDVGVRSDGSNGTTFWVQLPAADEAR